MCSSSLLTSFPSNSKNSNFIEIRYCVGATTCHTQFLFGGYSFGHPGVVIVPFSFVRSPPQAAVKLKENIISWLTVCFTIKWNMLRRVSPLITYMLQCPDRLIRILLYHAWCKQRERDSPYLEQLAGLWAEISFRTTQGVIIFILFPSLQRLWLFSHSLSHASPLTSLSSPRPWPPLFWQRDT